MSYGPTSDFVALFRLVSGRVRSEYMPGLDFVVVALMRAGLITLYVGQTAPTVNQAGTVWFKPATPSWSAEGVLYIWNTATLQYEVATPVLWMSLLVPSSATVLQDVNAAAAAVGIASTIVRVLNVGTPVTLSMPLASTKVGGVLISDWANSAGMNNIQINLAGADVFPGGVGTYTIAGDGGSIFLRPVPGGYVI